MDEIAKEAHFDYKLTVVDEHGHMDENGVWSGVVRKLVDKEADIGLGTMHVMAERETVIDFSVPFYDLVGTTVLMILPRSKNSLFKFLTVLETDVWFCILGAYFFTSFLMYVFDRWSPYSYQNNKEKYADDDEKREFTMRECLWFCMTSLTPQVNIRLNLKQKYRIITIIFVVYRVVEKLQKVMILLCIFKSHIQF